MLQFIGKHFGQLVFRCNRNNFGPVLRKFRENAIGPQKLWLIHHGFLACRWVQKEIPGDSMDRRRHASDDGDVVRIREARHRSHRHGNKPLGHELLEVG